VECEIVRVLGQAISRHTRRVSRLFFLLFLPFDFPLFPIAHRQVPRQERLLRIVIRAGTFFVSWMGQTRSKKAVS
jgi:hypothetical protein